MVAIADGTVVFMTIVVSMTKGFKEDPAAGDEAREKGKAVDAAAAAAWDEKEKKLKEEIARLREEVSKLRKKLGIKEDSDSSSDSEKKKSEGSDKKKDEKYDGVKVEEAIKTPEKPSADKKEQ